MPGGRDQHEEISLLGSLVLLYAFRIKVFLCTATLKGF